MKKIRITPDISALTEVARVIEDAINNPNNHNELDLDNGCYSIMAEEQNGAVIVSLFFHSNLVVSMPQTNAYLIDIALTFERYIEL